MKFAVNTGPTQTSGSYIVGKVYIAKPRMEVAGAVDFSLVRIEDETGRLLSFEPTEECGFWFPGSLPVVVTQHMRSNSLELLAGDVLTAYNLSTDGQYLNCGSGYVSLERVTVLDGTLLTPEMQVFDDASMDWQEISDVSTDPTRWMWVRQQESNLFQPVTDFALPVVDGELSTVPLVTSLVDGPDLKKGNLYQTTGFTENGSILILTKHGEYPYDRNFFDFFGKSWESNALSRYVGV